VTLSNGIACDVPALLTTMSTLSNASITSSYRQREPYRQPVGIDDRVNLAR
jgi:hypothetical protein